MARVFYISSYCLLFSTSCIFSFYTLNVLVRPTLVDAETSQTACIPMNVEARLARKCQCLFIHFFEIRVAFENENALLGLPPQTKLKKMFRQFDFDRPDWRNNSVHHFSYFFIFLFFFEHPLIAVNFLFLPKYYRTRCSWTKTAALPYTFLASFPPSRKPIYSPLPATRRIFMPYIRSPYSVAPSYLRYPGS